MRSQLIFTELGFPCDRFETATRADWGRNKLDTMLVKLWVDPVRD